MSDSALPLLLLLGIAGCGAPPSASRPSDFPAVESADLKVAQEPAATVGAARQIIYQATLVLHVEDFGIAERRISQLIKETGGYVAQFREDRPSGAQRGGAGRFEFPCRSSTASWQRPASWASPSSAK